jgi:hypothetical protein
MQELAHRIHDGEIGDLILMRGYRMAGPGGSAFATRWPGAPSELLWQIPYFHSFIWASGGCFNDFYIHIVDHCCWMKNAGPVKAQALGGRHYRLNSEGKPCVDQNFDVYSVEYTFADGAKLIMICFTRKKLKSRGTNLKPTLFRFGVEIEAILKWLPTTGQLFPYLCTVRTGDRATEFKQRCAGLGISGVSLHSYR